MRKIIDRTKLIVWAALVGLILAGEVAYGQSTFPSSPPAFYPPTPSSPGPPSYKPIPPQAPVPPSQAPSGAAKGAGVVNPRTGEFYPEVAGGVINPRTGVVLPKVEGGYMNPETGEVIPQK